MKTERIILKYVCALGLGLVLSMSCSKDENANDPGPGDDPDPQGTDLTFADVVADGGGFEEVPQSRTDETIKEEEEDPQDYEVEGEGGTTQTQRFICSSRTVNVLDGTGDFQTLGGAASEIYPGALLQGITINNAKPQAIPLKRAGGSISYSLNDGNLQAAQDLEEMSESQVRLAMNAIISGSSGVVPADFDLTYENVFSEQQVALNMGLSYEGYGVKAEGRLSFSEGESINRILVKLNQKYYDVSYDFPTGYDDVFDESVTPEDLEKYIQPDNPATYIKKVTYGRIFYMLIESTSSLTEMNTQIEGSYKGFKNEVQADLEVDTMKKMENLKVKVIAYGGDSSNTFSGLGETSVEALADMLAASTDIKTGLPLSYEIYSLEDPSKQVGTNISTEMKIVECELKGILPPPGYFNLVDVFEDGYGAATQIKNEITALFNGAGTEYVIFDDLEKSVSERYSIKDENGPLGATTFDKVGAALRQFEEEIFIFNELGTQYEIIDYEATFISTAPTSPIGSFRQENGANRRFIADDIFSKENGEPDAFVDGSLRGPEDRNVTCVTFPLRSKGIKAAVRRDSYEQIVGLYARGGIFPIQAVVGEVTSTYFYPYDNSGATFSRRNYYNPRAVIGPDGPLGFTDFNCWEEEKPVGGVRGTVEAACKVNYNEDVKFILYFTTDGLLVVRSLDGSAEQGPWAL